MKPVEKAPGGGRRGGDNGGASKCVICSKPAVAQYRPFCSKRCADVDLGRWLGGHYAVPVEPGEADEWPETGE